MGAPACRALLVPATCGPLCACDGPCARFCRPARSDKPLTLEYMRLKAEADALAKAVHEWRRKAEVARALPAR